MGQVGRVGRAGSGDRILGRRAQSASALRRKAGNHWIPAAGSEEARRVTKAGPRGQPTARIFLYSVSSYHVDRHLRERGRQSLYPSTRSRLSPPTSPDPRSRHRRRRRSAPCPPSNRDEQSHLAVRFVVLVIQYSGDGLCTTLFHIPFQCYEAWEIGGSSRRQPGPAPILLGPDAINFPTKVGHHYSPGRGPS